MCAKVMIDGQNAPALKLSANGRKRLPPRLGVVGQQCCFRLHGA